MIEVRITLSDTHTVTIADGNLAIEVDGAPLYEEPLEIAAPKLELVYTALGIAREELACEVDEF